MQFFTYSRPHLCIRADHRKVPGCLALTIRALQAASLSPEPRSVPEAVVQRLPRIVSGVDNNPPLGLKDLHISFCGVLGANLQACQDVLQPSTQYRLPLPSVITQRVLLEGLACTVDGEENLPTPSGLFV